MAKIRPLSDRVVVRVDKGADKSPGGIHIPDSAREKPQKARVLAVGPGKLNDNGSRAVPQVKVGDVVLFTRWAGQEVPGGTLRDPYDQRHKTKEIEEGILVLFEADILAVIEDE